MRILFSLKRIGLALGLLLWLAVPTQAATALVVGSNSRCNAAAGDPQTCAQAQNVVGGNTIVFYVAWLSNVGTLDTVTTNCGGTVVVKDNPTTLGVVQRGAHGYVYNVSTGACTLTYDFSASAAFHAGQAEVSGVPTTDPIDGTSVCSPQTNPGTGTDAVTSTTTTPAANGAFIWGGTADMSNGGTINVGTNFTSVSFGDTLQGSLRTEYLIQGAAAAIAATFTNTSAGQDNISCVLALKEAGGGAASKDSMGLMGVIR